MTDTCMTCGVRADQEHKIKILSEVMEPGKLDAGTIKLCRGCLDRRETRTWSRKGGDGRRLYRALRQEEHVPAHRFTYLTDRERIHLTRLDRDWVHRHEIRP